MIIDSRAQAEMMVSFGWLIINLLFRLLLSWFLFFQLLFLFPLSGQKLAGQRSVVLTYERGECTEQEEAIQHRDRNQVDRAGYHEQTETD